MHAEIPFEPLTALAGGIIGGIAAVAVIWHLAWKIRTTTTRGVRA